MTWAARHQSIAVDRKLTQIDPIAVLAAVSASHGVELVKQYPKSVDKYKFEEFLQLLRAKIGDRRVVLVLDNLSVHSCAFTKHRMALHGFKWAYTPIYHPDSNPIESCFAIFKRQLKKLKLRNVLNDEKVRIDELIDRSFAIVS